MVSAWHVIERDPNGQLHHEPGLSGKSELANRTDREWQLLVFFSFFFFFFLSYAVLTVVIEPCSAHGMLTLSPSLFAYTAFEPSSEEPAEAR